MRENMQNAMTLRINAGTLTGTCIPHVVKYRAITSFFFFRSLGRIYDINSQTVRHVKKEENCHFVLKIRILDFNDLFGLLTYNHLHRPPTPPSHFSPPTGSLGNSDAPLSYDIYRTLTDTERQEAHTH